MFLVTFIEALKEICGRFLSLGIDGSRSSFLSKIPRIARSNSYLFEGSIEARRTTGAITLREEP